MAAELEAPTDRITGVPFPLLPHQTSVIDINHQIFHSDEPELQTVGGQAVRNARIQDVDIADHVVFHQRYGWINIPPTPQDQLNYLAFIASGYIPPFAIDVRKKRPWVRRLEEDEIARLASGEIRVGSNFLISNFLVDYALQYPEIDGIYDVDEFVNTSSIARRRTLSHSILGDIISQSLEDIKPDFKKARKVGFMAINNFDRVTSRMAAKISPSDREKFMNKLWWQQSRISILPEMEIVPVSDAEPLQTEVDEVELAA